MQFSYLTFILAPMLLQGLSILFDEFYFHHKRRLPRWEIIGHPLDTLTVIATLALAIFASPTQANGFVYVAIGLFSTFFVTKDEWVHSEKCQPSENWLHSILFVLHPTVFVSAAMIWLNPGQVLESQTQEFLKQALYGHFAIINLFLLYQIVYWPFFGTAKAKVNNDLYDELGDRWYTAYDDPVALLRAECKVKKQWIESQLTQLNPAASTQSSSVKILDIGCGAGFLANALATSGYSMTAVDLSNESLKVARKYDLTGKVQYQLGDATQLDFAARSFDTVTALDLLEHVEKPEEVIREASKVLKIGGLFFFHTFNRNFLSHLIIIKLVEWMVRNTPKNMHVHHLFITPAELKILAEKHGFTVLNWVGLRPKLSTITLKGLFTRTVPEDFSFALTRSLKLSYMGVARLDRITTSAN